MLMIVFYGRKRRKQNGILELALRKLFDKDGNRRLPDHMNRGDETER